MEWTDPIEWMGHADALAAQMNTYVRDNLNYLRTKIGKGEAVELTIDAADTVTVTQAYHTIDTLAHAATGNLVTIAGVNEGDIIILRAEDDTRTVVLKAAGVGNLKIGNDIYLDDINKYVMLICDDAGDLNLLYTARDVTFMANAFQYPNPTVEWVPSGFGAYLPVDKTGAVVYLPLNFLKIGDVIISYNLTGDMIVTDTSTLDCKLVRVNLAVNPIDPITTFDIPNGAIVPQITTDGNFDVTANVDDETVATDKMYYLLITGTTDATATITVMGAEVLIRRLT